jgi:hypothetical protein
VYSNSAYVQYINNVHIQYINNVHIQLLPLIKKNMKNISNKLVSIIVLSIIVFSCNTNDDEKIKIEYLTSEKSKIDEKYIDVKKTLEVLPKKSVLVLIDLWEDKFLDDIIKEFINPLITETSEQGVHIIYSPSRKKQNKNLKIIENSITLYNLDMMDEYISNNEINNIFYVGFDALYCLIDKPNGIFSFKKRNDKKLNYFVFENGVTSYTREMKDVALALFKKNNIGVVKKQYTNYEGFYPRKTETDLYKKTKKDTIYGKNFVLIFKNNKSDFSQDLFIDKLRNSNIDYAEIIDERLYFKNKIISNSYEFIHLIKKLNIDNIYYSGYYLNNQILWSNFGITNLYIKKYSNRIPKTPEIYVINDMVYIAEDSNIDPKTEKAVIINHYRGIKNILSQHLFISK